MTITTHKILSYTIDEHPDKEAVYDWIRSNWHDLGDHILQEYIDSLKGFCRAFDLELKNWSIGIFPDRGEFIDIRVNDELEEIVDIRLYKYVVNNFAEYLAGDCPFTGVCYDEDLVDPIRDFLKKPALDAGYTWQDLVNDCAHNLLKTLHAEGEYTYSDEGLKELCEANEYEFYEDGNFLK